jgi:hypothetical protein
LFIDNMPYKSMLNDPYSAIFLESFNGLHGEDQYLLGSIFRYLENLHLFGYNVPTFDEHNPFGRIRLLIDIIQDIFKFYLWNVIKPTNPLFVTIWNWNWNKKYFINCSSSNFVCLNISRLFFW